jgi:formamidopyrimidine-DNA glycosylase
MPELPEVEVTRRSFAAAIEGGKVLSMTLGKPLRWPLGCEPHLLVGRTVVGVRRRGKYLLVDLDHGLLLVHLGMSGSLRFAMQLPEAGVHDHWDLVTSRGTLRLHDPRRFGAVVYADSDVAPIAVKLLGGLGVEPLDEGFAVDAFVHGVRKSRLPIKQLLLAGRLVVGVGNIYASEALFLAGIRPTVRSSALSVARIKRLHQCIRTVLENAVSLGGSSLKDFSSADGSTGQFQESVYVYGRAGAPCLVCATPIKMVRQGQRSSFYCSVCQR